LTKKGVLFILGARGRMAMVNEQWAIEKGGRLWMSYGLSIPIRSCSSF